MQEGSRIQVQQICFVLELKLTLASVFPGKSMQEDCSSLHNVVIKQLRHNQLYSTMSPTVEETSQVREMAASAS